MSSPQLFLHLSESHETDVGLVKSNIHSPDEEIAPDHLGPDFLQENNYKDVRAEEDPRCTETSSVSSTESDEKRSLGQSLSSKVADDDDDGFKTPTDQKIPVITECPPAPKKIRPSSSTKRKLVQPRVRGCRQLDLSREVESMFPPTVRGDLGRKIKKARTEDDNSS